MGLRTELDEISARSEAAVDGLFARHRAGQLTEERFTKSAAAVVDKNNAQAVANANREVALRKAAAEGRAGVRPAGARPYSDRERLEGAVKSTRTKKDGTPEDPETRRERLKRLGRSEPYSSAQDAMPKAMKAQGAKGWKRVPNGDACKLCRKWADGKIRPPTMRMLRHPGCSCLQQPVFRGKVKSQEELDRERRRRDRQKRFVKKAIPAIVVADTAVEVVILGRVATQGRSSMLAGGRRAYARLMRLEKAAEMGGPVAERIREKIRDTFIGRTIQSVFDAIGIDPFHVNMETLRTHAADHEEERFRGKKRSPCWKNRHFDFTFHRWLPALLQKKYPDVSAALLRSSPRWGRKAGGGTTQVPFPTGLPLPEMARLGKVERQLAVLDGRFIHQADTQAFLDNLAQNDYTPEEVEALWEYAGLYFEPGDAATVYKGPVERYNQKLRGLHETPLTEDDWKVIRLVDQAIAKNVTPRDITVYRGAELSDESLARLIDGDEFLDESYSFTGLTEARALPHASLDRDATGHYRPVIFEIELPKGSNAISSPYGIGLGKGILSRAIPIPGKGFKIRVPFLRHFNKEELVLPRGMPMQILSSEVREDGRTVIRLLAPKPADATRADRVNYYERLIRLAPAEDRAPLVARIMEIHSRPDFTDLDEIEDVTVAFHKFEAGLEAAAVRLELDTAIAAKLRQIAELKKRHRLARKETVARHPSGGSQTAAHQAEMDALTGDLERLKRTRRRIDEPIPTGGSGDEGGFRITAATPRRTIAGKETRVTSPGEGPPMHPDLIPDDAVADTIRRVSQIPGYEDLAGLTDRAVFEEIMRRQANEIIDIAQLSMDLSPEATELHATWYPFIHDWLDGLADATIGRAVPVTRNGSYAATAVLSPGAEWPENVAWAKRMIDAISDDVTIDAEWITARYLNEVDLWKVEGGPRPRRRKGLEGKKLSEIVDKKGNRDDEALVYVFRAWHDFEPVKQLGGHSGFGDPLKTARPQSEVNITKAISVLYDGSLENIDRALGNGQKVRSFFNNMARPLDTVDLDVTVDTHHFGLVNGIPMTMSSKYIKSGPFNITASPDRKPQGVGGTYPLSVEATRRATAILNARWGTDYLPEQIQSITWEMWQALHPDWSRRGPGAKRINDGVAKAHTARAQGHITLEEEKRRVEAARLDGGAPSHSEMMMIFRADLAGETPPSIGQVRLARERARKARLREAVQEEKRRQRDGG